MESTLRSQNTEEVKQSILEEEEKMKMEKNNMAIQSQILSRKYVRCAMCQSQATQNHFVESAGGILCVCDYCNFILELKDRIAELEFELAQYKAEGN